ncbi:hypothetical protein D3C84_910040 [compost metagenome]
MRKRLFLEADDHVLVRFAFLVLIDETGQHTARLHNFRHRCNAVRRIVIREFVQIDDILFEPVIRIHLIERDARAEYVN